MLFSSIYLLMHRSRKALLVVTSVDFQVLCQPIPLSFGSVYRMQIGNLDDCNM